MRLNKVVAVSPTNDQKEDAPFPIVRLPDDLKGEVAKNLTVFEIPSLRETNNALASSVRIKQVWEMKIDAFKKFMSRLPSPPTLEEQKKAKERQEEATKPTTAEQDFAAQKALRL